MNKNLENSVKDGAANSVSVGAGEAFIAPYAVLRGASEAYLGWLAAIPALVGAFFQLLSPYAVKTYGYRKGLVLTGVTLNALSWLLILSTVLVSAETALPLLIVFFSVYVAANTFANPVWSGWMASLVPQNIRGTFFGRRNAVTQLASLSATLAAGFLLGFFQDGYVILGFAFLFSASFLARLASLHYLRRVDELERPAYTPVENPCQFVCKPFNHEIRNTVFLTSVFLFAVNVAAPFFVLYMLRNLHFTLLEYTFLILAAGLARVVAMPY
ncbi:hypothetical protein COX85_00135 [Candidatus Micrarchaeota archaeon CG_4_10_14_0_2_um_filter_55_9]|nr:MAG: hypothetical protein AUJ15_03775 [Candidatus Micrarchaeota archaeon CG1_02_55_41]PIO02646.1 MAG: hypothetical protein COT57_02995 [Candidatus Micrarchaeota archaeon CG09_land_8_20_14_0_10_55_25]PIZ92177.1 MAG: hypothetical protein COX85_00135 [Candidatus Micrarchaeota archaeon CG_4_10_14_0_2_um_filter_55_9]